MSKTYSTGDVLDVRVEKIVPRGFGLAFAQKLTIMVPLTTPGDELRVRIIELRKRLAFAEIVEVITPGPGRVHPPCPYFGNCGGCNFQQLSYEAQLDAKAGILRDCLERIAKIEFKADIPIIGSPQEYSYRSRARWHVDTEGRRLGYYRRDSNEVIDVEVCPVLTPVMQSALDQVRANMTWETLTSEHPQIEAAGTEDGSVSIWSQDLSGSPSELIFSVNGDEYAYSAEVFFQANQYLIGELIKAAVGTATGETALDLYAGVGLFAVPLARRSEKVIAVEEHPSAAAFARRNTGALQRANVSVVCSSVAGFLSRTHLDGTDLILIDPPRSGPEHGVMQKLASLKAPSFVYVACEPSILARDLRVLLDAGYVIDDITAIDLFPQTHHVETVVRLSI